MTLLPMRGRGASHDPPNRFERLAVELDADVANRRDDDPLPRTQFYRDHTRDPISTNDSPDVPMAAGINPYRGCEHGCVYCLAPDTPILYADLSWRPIGEVAAGDELIGFDEYPEPGRTRKLRRSVVEAVWWSRKPTLEVVTERTRVRATAEHRWLQSRDFRWSRTDQLAPGRTLRHLQAPPSEPEDDDYRLGYVAGMTLGDGTMRFTPGQASDKRGFPMPYWRVALVDEEPLDRLQRYLLGFGIAVTKRPFSAGNDLRKALQKVETRAIGALWRIHDLLTVERPTRSYRRGFLAGFFDAEGSHSGSLRMSQVDTAVLDRVGRYGRDLGFTFRLEERKDRASTIRLVGSVRERMHFLGVCRPAIRRKLEAVLGCQPATAVDRIQTIETGPVSDVVDIQTSTGTFYAAGLATHNCFARPTHEYLGFSAGLDFETKIMVKEDAPALLRKRLASPRWEPKPLMLSGNTDPYQPVERRLGLTRGILEVLAEFRNPVAVITKNHLVTRDADLLADLASHDAGAVVLSVTTLRNDLQRIMEPRTSIPARRLAAMEALAKAGVPVGVNVAPVIPGLTDDELPAILQAAADAGATSAGFILLRLPHAVAPMFEQWLEQHFPDRREKVLNRLRSMRGGKLYDATWGARKRGEGPYADQIRAMFEVSRRKAGLEGGGGGLSTAAFRRPHDAKGQLGLF